MADWLERLSRPPCALSPDLTHAPDELSDTMASLLGPADVVARWPPPAGRRTVCLSPMVRANTTALRVLSLGWGADVAYSEELVAQKLRLATRVDNPALGTADYVVGADKSNNRQGSLVLRVDVEREVTAARTLVVQLGACDSKIALEAALVAAPDAAGVDLNMGCPKNFSTQGGMGSALLKTPHGSSARALRSTPLLC